MKSNYKRLGNYIQQVSTRNINLHVNDLQGIRINKEFMPSVANIVGTDLSKYKIVTEGQFAYNPMHVGRDEVLPISLLHDKESIIVSPAYVVFEIIDVKQLLPEYLMMWFRRTEFDRNAWFTTDSSVRGGFGWEELCNMELPVPEIKTQKVIVKEYNAIVNRIKLNENLDQKLKETVQSIYNRWFVEFEFPDKQGNPYKSSGGKMIYNEKLGQDVPEGWEIVPFTKAVSLKGGGTPSTTEESYWNGEVPFFTPADVTRSYYSTITEKNITRLGLKNCSSSLYPKNTVFVTARGTVGAIALAGCNMAMNQSCYAIIGEPTHNQYYTHQLTIQALGKLKREAIGAVFNALVTKDFDGQNVVKPTKDVTLLYGNKCDPLYSLTLNFEKQNMELHKLKELVLSKIATIKD